MTQEDCQVTASLVNNVNVPNLNDNDVEDIMEWIGHISLSIQSDPPGDQSASVIQAKGLYHTR